MRASGSGILHQLVAAVAHERGAVERALADQRLGVDREPAALLVEQHVAGVGVLVQDHRLARARQQLADEPGGEVDEVRLGRRPARVYGGPRSTTSSRRMNGASAGGRRRPQAPQDAGRDRVGHRLVGQARSACRAGARRSTSSARRSASASSSRAAPSPSQWASAAASCSVSGSGKVIFSTARGAVAPLGGHDERDRGRLERVAQPQLPALGALRGQARERGEPLRAALLRPPPPQPVRHPHAL